MTELPAVLPPGVVLRETPEEPLDPSRPIARSDSRAHDATRVARTSVGGAADVSGTRRAKKERGHPRVAIALVSCGLLVGGSVASVRAAQDLAGLRNAIRAECFINAFEEIDLNTAFDANETDCNKVSCGFEVQAQTIEGQEEFTVRNWLPRKASDHDGGAMADGAPFRCCPPWSMTLRNFYREDHTAFCDDWKAIDDSCPQAPWNCFFFAINFKNNTNIFNTPYISGDDLHLGDTRESIPKLIVYLALFVAGCLVAPCLKRSVWLGITKNFERYVTDQFLTLWKWLKYRFIASHEQLALVLPLSLCTEQMIHVLYKDQAARTIQPHVRDFLARRRSEKIEFVKTVAEEVPAEKHENEFQFVSHRVPLPGQGSSCVDTSRLLYDTGDLSTSRRLVRSRVLSGPGDAILRIEVLLGSQTPGFGVTVAVADVSDPPIITKVEVCGLGANYGLEEGMHLIKACTVGETLQWPSADSAQLLSAVTSAPRPTVLTFVGMPLPPSSPKFVCPEPPPALPPELWPVGLRGLSAGRLEETAQDERKLVDGRAMEDASVQGDEEVEVDDDGDDESDSGDEILLASDVRTLDESVCSSDLRQLGACVDTVCLGDGFEATVAVDIPARPLSAGSTRSDAHTRDRSLSRPTMAESVPSHERLRPRSAGGLLRQSSARPSSAIKADSGTSSRPASGSKKSDGHTRNHSWSRPTTAESAPSHGRPRPRSAGSLLRQSPARPASAIKADSRVSSRPASGVSFRVASSFTSDSTGSMRARCSSRPGSAGPVDTSWPSRPTSAGGAVRARGPSQTASVHPPRPASIATPLRPASAGHVPLAGSAVVRNGPLFVASRRAPVSMENSLPNRHSSSSYPAPRRSRSGSVADARILSESPVDANDLSSLADHFHKKFSSGQRPSGASSRATARRRSR